MMPNNLLPPASQIATAYAWLLLLGCSMGCDLPTDEDSPELEMRQGAPPCEHRVLGPLAQGCKGCYFSFNNEDVDIWPDDWLELYIVFNEGSVGFLRNESKKIAHGGTSVTLPDYANNWVPTGVLLTRNVRFCTGNSTGADYDIVDYFIDFSKGGLLR